MTRTSAREIMKDSGIKNIRTYKFVRSNSSEEMVFYSEYTHKYCIVCDRDDWYTGADLRSHIAA